MPQRTRRKKDKIADLSHLDGAHYWKPDAKVEDYLDGEDGLRPGEKTKPSGAIRVSLMSSRGNVILPPRWIWKTGSYKATSFTGNDATDYNTWVVTGEGTPGNYLLREYVLPDEVAYDPEPSHPADWKQSVFKKKSTSITKTTTTKSVAPALPFGIRFRDPNCGHWFKEADLAGHAKVCPGQQEGESDWAIACECCESLDDTAKCKKGFPRPKPKPVAEKPAKGIPLVKEAKPDGDGTPAT